METIFPSDFKQPKPIALIPNLNQKKVEVAEKIVFLLKYTLFALSHSVMNKYEIMNQLKSH